MGLRDWSILVVLSFLWGGSFFFVEIAVEALPPFTIVAFRVDPASSIPEAWANWVYWAQLLKVTVVPVSAM